jgi:hypothetical protein
LDRIVARRRQSVQAAQSELIAVVRFLQDRPITDNVLSKRDSQLMHKVFDRVVDNGRVLRTLFQMIRSGQFGRTSLSSSLQRAFQRWLNEDQMPANGVDA